MASKRASATIGGSGASNSPAACPARTTSGERAGLGREVSAAAGQVRRSQRREQLVEAVGVVADAIEPEQHALDEHRPNPPGRRAGFGRVVPQPDDQPIHDAVDGAEHHLFLAGEVDVDSPLPDAGRFGHVVHRRLRVPEDPDEPLGGVENQVACSGRVHGELRSGKCNIARFWFFVQWNSGGLFLSFNRSTVGGVF